MSFDLFPTMVSLAEVRNAKEIAFDGIDLSPILRSEARDSPLEGRTLYWQAGQQLAVRQGKWKLVVRAKGRQKAKKEQLFDLSKDLGEKTDLSETNPGRTKLMTKMAKRWLAEMREGATKQPEK